MNVQLCKERKHHYDMDKYGDECPICRKEREKSERGIEQDASVSTAAKPATMSLKKRVSQWVKTGKQDESKNEETEVAFKEPVKNKENATLSFHESIELAKGTLTDENNNVVLEQTGQDSMQEDQDNVKTVSVFGTEGGVNPVVGWMVCIQGPYYGESFSLHAGMNHIGRHTTMDIALIKDKKVSREKHATVIYDNKKKDYYLQMAEGHSNVYLNDDIVLTHSKLNSEDIIEIGDSKLMFIPFETSKFQWD